MNSIVAMYEIGHENMSCDEIAEDLQIQIGKGYCLKIEPVSSIQELKVLEYSSIETYMYHCIYVLDTDAYDIRYSKKPIELSEYKKMIESINNTIKLKYTKYTV